MHDLGRTQRDTAGNCRSKEDSFDNRDLVPVFNYSQFDHRYWYVFYSDSGCQQTGAYAGVGEGGITWITDSGMLWHFSESSYNHPPPGQDSAHQTSE